MTAGRPVGRRWVVILSLLAACADDPVVGAGPSGPSLPAADIPTQVELVCGADGSVSLSSDRVQPQPDGVHLDVENGFDEPVSGPPPLDIAREVIVGLLPDDVLRLTGYPEQEGAGIAVLRDGQVVAAYGIARFEGRSWEIVGGTACPDTGLPLAGEQMG